MRPNGTIPNVFWGAYASPITGSWVAIDSGRDNAREALQAIQDKYPQYEEWCAMDNDFGAGEIGLSEVLEVAELFEEHEDNWVKILELNNHLGGVTISDSIEYFAENWAGEGSLEDFAEELLSDTGALSGMPEDLRYYFDFKSYGRDLELNGDVFIIGEDIYWNR